MSTGDKGNSRHRRDPVAFTGVQGNDLRVIVVQDSGQGIQNRTAELIHVRLSGEAWSASAEFAVAGVVALRANEDEGNPYPYR
jgi:hypothetical protein